MNLRKFLIPILTLLLITFSCKDDDLEDFIAVPDRDRDEVNDENDAEIRSYLDTHFFNYEDFDFSDATNPANNEFIVVLDTISADNGTQNKTPLSFYLENPTNDYPKLYIKTVVQDDIDYNLYILKVREGEGEEINALDAAAMLYSGTIVDGSVFDSQVNIESGQPFNLTGVGIVGGVVAGFREGVIEFKTSTGFIENTDGSITYKDHGVGVVFMPSGLGYFSLPPIGSIPQYSPLFFNLKIISRTNTDFDLDGIPSHLEHPDGDITGDEDNSDDDLLVDFIDNDDDDDGILTSDEVEQKEYEGNGINQFMTKAEAQDYFDNDITDEVFISIVGELDGTFTLNTLIVPSTMVNGISVPNYLNSEVAIELE
ncbi:hypothetical protein [Lacinutrix sp.]|uniref:FKBP-type peptidyl-prolyl cis-trans isomerase n=1 Tax=Lacinutrix sp. TaxID=1937692 RepID=UPI0025BA247E|nr:hypothetical protein [Lacinutrix sp.]